VVVLPDHFGARSGHLLHGGLVDTVVAQKIRDHGVPGRVSDGAGMNPISRLQPSVYVPYRRLDSPTPAVIRGSPFGIDPWTAIRTSHQIITIRFALGHALEECEGLGLEEKEVTRTRLALFVFRRDQSQRLRSQAQIAHTCLGELAGSCSGEK